MTGRLMSARPDAASSRFSGVIVILGIDDCWLLRHSVSDRAHPACAIPVRCGRYAGATLRFMWGSETHHSLHFSISSCYLTGREGMIKVDARTLGNVGSETSRSQPRAGKAEDDYRICPRSRSTEMGRRRRSHESAIRNTAPSSGTWFHEGVAKIDG
jgi:hypothetical protein